MQQSKSDLEAIEKRIAAHHEVLRPRAANADTTYKCSIQSIVIAAAFIYTKLVLNDMEFSDGKLDFDGHGWGAGLGGATLYGGAGTFVVPPSQLPGDATFQVTVVGGVGAGIQITFWDGNGNYLGICGAGGLGVALGEFKGSGTFSND